MPCQSCCRSLPCLFRWCAPWLRHLKKLTARWAGAIERAVWGGAIPRGRSRALAWTTLVGLQYFPDYVNAEATVLQEHRRLLLGHHPREAPNTRAAFSYFGWQRAGDPPSARLLFAGFFDEMVRSGSSRRTLRPSRRAASPTTLTSRTTRRSRPLWRATPLASWWVALRTLGASLRPRRTTRCGCAFVGTLAPLGRI